VTSLALVGGQYGSEGKGVIAAGLAHLFEAAVRTGGPNAGHSLYHRQQLYKMRQVPCAWVNDECRLFIGAGAVVNPVLLEEEARRVGRAVFIDPQAALVLPHHEHAEKHMGLREQIGSTTEGVGAARIEKIARDGVVVLARDYDWASGMVVLENVADELYDLRKRAGYVMLEGTQGAGLSLHHGQYPFVTSAETNAAALAADAGIPPSDVEHTHLVVRTFPIRVAGNSGPTGGEELEWDFFQQRGVVEVPERTTVTNNVRRIFAFSSEDLRRAILLNDPCGVWITFGDYLDPKVQGVRDIDDLMDIPQVQTWMSLNIWPTGVRVLGIGVGGDFWDVAETGDTCHRAAGWHVGQEWPLRTYNTVEDTALADFPF
jgi:adenylosuccinate synthase